MRRNRSTHSRPRPRAAHWIRCLAMLALCTGAANAPPQARAQDSATGTAPATQSTGPAIANEEPSNRLVRLFEQQVSPRLSLPDSELAPYTRLLQDALTRAGARIDRPQVVLLVDRNPHVQAGMLWWVAPEGQTALIGATPVSTGRPGAFEYFETPLGVFEHSLANPDFRAEGTRNEYGIRGYGVKGMRVFDFGWVVAARGWRPGEQAMRLQVHATDPDRLEPLLGQRASKGCVRIPASLNTLLDRHGLLDADYDRALALGQKLWVLRPDREPSPWAGRWLVVVDSDRTHRPDWSPGPKPAAPARHAALQKKVC